MASFWNSDDLCLCFFCDWKVAFYLYNHRHTSLLNMFNIIATWYTSKSYCVDFSSNLGNFNPIFSSMPVLKGHPCLITKSAVQHVCFSCVLHYLHIFYLCGDTSPQISSVQPEIITFRIHSTMEASFLQPTAVSVYEYNNSESLKSDINITNVSFQNHDENFMVFLGQQRL